MLHELIDHIAAGFRPDFVEQTVTLRIHKREDAIADQQKSGKVNE
jgi:hypothetical protein